MPKVDGKEYPYSEEGQKAAAAARLRIKPNGKERNEVTGKMTEDRTPAFMMMKNGKKVDYKSMDEKQAAIRKHKKAKKSEGASRKRGVEAHEGEGTFKSAAPNKVRTAAMHAGMKEKERLMRFDYAEPPKLMKFVRSAHEAGKKRGEDLAPPNLVRPARSAHEAGEKRGEELSAPKKKKADKKTGKKVLPRTPQPPT
tara:strand:+ start:2716 stop:3306 length:591 start_codon:yes stop_codon:yes gene_type:complete